MHLHYQLHDSLLQFATKKKVRKIPTQYLRVIVREACFLCVLGLSLEIRKDLH